MEVERDDKVRREEVEKEFEEVGVDGEWMVV